MKSLYFDGDSHVQIGGEQEFINKESAVELIALIKEVFEIESEEGKQLAEANKHLQEAWKMQADMQIVIDRYKNFPQD